MDRGLRRVRREARSKGGSGSMREDVRLLSDTL
jgi:hypothetical protein